MEISLALGGGGIKGVAHIGVLECLEKAGFQIRAIAGTSAGGLVGAVYAAGFRPKEILAIMESLNPKRMYARNTNDGPSLLGYTGVAEALLDVLDGCTFSDLKVPFACTAVDIHTSQEMYLNDGPVLDAVLSTIAIPGIFPPKKRGAAELVDGSVLDPVPVLLARRMAPRLPVVAVVLNPAREEWPLIPEFRMIPSAQLPIPLPILENFSRMRIGQAIHIFLDSMDITSRMITELRLEADRPEGIIRPDVSKYGMLDAVIPAELFEVGYRAAGDALPGLHKVFSWQNRLSRTLRRVVSAPDACKAGSTNSSPQEQKGSTTV